MGATKGNGSLHDLTGSQVAAVNALLAGGTHEDAALAAGVHRVTVTRWVNHHPAVIAEMNRIRADLANRTHTKVLRVTELALGVVETALGAGDLETALKWLRLVPPSLMPVAVGPTDSVDVVESVRRRMPTALDDLIHEGDGRTTAAAERVISERFTA